MVLQLSGDHQTCPKQLCTAWGRGRAAMTAPATPNRATHIQTTQNLCLAARLFPPVSSSTSIPRSKPQNFTFSPFPPAPLSRAHVFLVGSSTPCPHAIPQPGPTEANGAVPADPNESGNLLSGHHDFSAHVSLAIAIGQDKLQKSPGSCLSLPSQADTCAAPPQLSSLLTTEHVFCGSEMG